MKFLIVLFVTMLSVALAKPTPGNDSESIDDISVTPKIYVRQRRQADTPFTAPEDRTSITERLTKRAATIRTGDAEVRVTDPVDELVTGGGEDVLTSNDSGAPVGVVTVLPPLP